MDSSGKKLIAVNSATGTGVKESAFAGDKGMEKEIKSVSRYIRRLYLEDQMPWIVAYSGGKDSTAVLQLVWTAIAGLEKLKKIGKPIEFRIDRIPPPNASINGKREGRMSRAQLSRAQGIASKLTNFPFDLKYKVISYECKMKVGEFKKTFKKKGNKFDTEIKEKIKKLKPGSDITFQAIKAKGPDGVKTCPPIVLTVQ